MLREGPGNQRREKTLKNQPYTLTFSGRAAARNRAAFQIPTVDAPDSSDAFDRSESDPANEEKRRRNVCTREQVRETRHSQDIAGHPKVRNTQDRPTIMRI